VKLSVVYGNGYAFIPYGVYNIKDLFLIVSVNIEEGHVTRITLRPFASWNFSSGEYEEYQVVDLPFVLYLHGLLKTTQ
jgi:hypothetical protein